MIKLNKKDFYIFKVKVNHGNDLLDHGHTFKTVEEFKSYVKDLSREMRAKRTVTITKPFEHEIVTTDCPLTVVDTKTKLIICRY